MGYFIAGIGLHMIAGASVYMTASFKGRLNQHYNSVENMRKSIEILRNSPAIHLPTLEYGRFQPILAPLESQWPGGGLKVYMREMGSARLHLTAQPNEDALSKDEPDVKPLTRCALLDAALRKCFNSEPPIPMDVDVMQKDEGDPDRDVHAVELVWTYKEGSNTPVRLRFTMICPWKEPAFAQSSDSARKQRALSLA